MENIIDTDEIIRDFGSMENFKEAYVQALIDNIYISRLDKKMRGYLAKYVDLMVIGFDITQPNLLEDPEFGKSSWIRKDLRDDGCVRLDRIGNFYNKPRLYELENLDQKGREKFIRAYFEKNSIFRTNIEMTLEEREELVELYSREVERTDERKLENFNLSKRTYNALVRNGYMTVDDLLAVEDESEFMQIRNIGKNSFEEIRELLAQERSKSLEEQELESLIQELYATYDQLNALQDKFKKIEEELKRRGVKSTDDVDDDAR